MKRLVGLLVALVGASACGGDGGDIEGVVYGLYGERLVGALVVVNGDDENLVVTGADGAFQFKDVSAPYNLTVIHERELLELRELRERKLRVPVYGYVTPREARIAGWVEGADFPLPSRQQVLVSMTGKRVSSGIATEANGSFQGVIQWDGPASLDGDLVAVQLEERGEGSAHFLLKGARKGVRLSEETNLSEVSVPLTSEIHTRETRLIHGPGAYDSDYGVWLASFTVQGASFQPYFGAIPSGTRVDLPSEGGTFAARGADSDGNTALVVAKAALDGTTRIDLPTSTKLKAVQPVNSSTEGPRPTFLWTPVQGAKSIALRLREPESGTQYTFLLPGKSDRFRLPDYNYGGMGLQRNTTYHWSVVAHMNDGMRADQMAVGEFKDPRSPHVSFQSDAVFRTGE